MFLNKNAIIRVNLCIYAEKTAFLLVFTHQICQLLFSAHCLVAGLSKQPPHLCALLPSAWLSDEYAICRNSLGMPTGKLRERMLHEREKTAQELAKFKIIFKKSVRRHLQHAAAWQEMSILMHTISAEWWVIVVANVTHWQTEGYKIRRISLTRNIYYFASSSHINGGAITY